MSNSLEQWKLALPGTLDVEVEGRVALLKINRSAKRNALSDEVVLGLHTAVKGVPAEISCIIVHGAGGNFCAGLDLNEISVGEADEVIATSVIGQQLNDAIQFARVPVLSVLQGAVIGGGMELAAATHIRVAEPSAYYALPEGMRGIFLGSGGASRLPRLIGNARVMDMLLTGRTMSADEGQESGFSQYLVEAGAGLNTARQLAERIVANAPMANFAIIQALPRIAESSPAAGMLIESLMAAVAATDPEARSRLAEFLARKTGKVDRSK